MSDLLVCGTSDRFGHLAILPHRRQPRRPLTPYRHAESCHGILMHKVEHGLVDCYGPLRTRTDTDNQRSSPARHPPSAQSRSDASMQKAITLRGPPSRAPPRAYAAANPQSGPLSSPGE
jgi:hypothetical protein